MNEHYKLYDGKIILEYNDAKHIYKVNGKIIYGVTSIIGVLDKPALMYWSVNMAIEFLQRNLKPGKALDEIQLKQLLEDARKAHTIRKDKSADIGTMIHDWLNRYIQARLTKKPIPKKPVSKEMNTAIDSFYKWAKEHKVKLIASEQKIYSKKYKYAGTYDLEALVDGKRTIIDFKTSNAIYPEMFLQASAYLQAREEEKGEKYDGGVAILRLAKKDKEKNITPFEIKQIDRNQVSTLIKVFVCALQIYKWKMMLKKQELLEKVK